MSNKFLSWVIMTALVIAWGSSFILIKRGLLYFDAIEVGALRVVITFLSLLPFALLKMRTLNKSDFYWLSLSGIMGSLLPAFLFAMAQTGIDSSTAGLLNSLTPLFTLILGFLIFKLKSKFINIVGVFVGLIGAIGLINVSGGNAFAFNLKYASYIILATIFYATNVNLIKAKLKHIDALTITSMTFFAAGIIASFILFFGTDAPAKIMNEPSSRIGLIYLGILAVIGTALAMIAFNALIKITSPIFASSVTYLIPLVAMMWGFSDGEYFSFQHFIWIALIIGGVILVNLKKPRRTPILPASGTDR
ncbi:MAG: DMT family transporter [Ignavibacteria bacterium]|nr:DMT family transporter [Ignavibacteria bacterium]